MTPVYKLSANSVKNGRTVYGSMLAGNTAYVLPTDFESIATVTVGSGGAADVEFTSIPGTYTHLQVRAMWRATTNPKVAYNGDTTNTNYYRHYMGGNGSSVYVGADNTNTYFGYMDTLATSTFCLCVMDILDYTDTNKYKTMRTLTGNDRNGSGDLFFYSGLWKSTSAITSMKFTMNDASNFTQYTHFALYGIKGA